MPYIQEECIAGKTIEVIKRFSFRWHKKGEKRSVKENPTIESQEKINQRKAVVCLRRLLNHNFQDGDLLVRLDFKKEERPAGSKEMHIFMKNAIRKLMRAFKKENKILRYVFVKEVGPKGGRHIHMVMSKCDTDLLRKVWSHGGIHIDPLNSNGQYAKIAEYFIKYSLRTEETEGEHLGKRWYASRSCEKPIIRRRVISANAFRKEIKKAHQKLIASGRAYLEKETLRSGISEVTGFEYFSYTLIKNDQQIRGR